MEDFAVDPFLDEQGRVSDYLESFRIEGESQLATLDKFLAGLQELFEKSKDSEGIEGERCKLIERITNSVKDYIRHREWFDEFGYEPRTRLDQYDFDRFLKRIKNKPLSTQKEYWETVLLEVEKFCVIDRSVDTFGNQQSAKNGFIFDVTQELVKVRHELSIDAKATLNRSAPSGTPNFNKIKWNGNLNLLVTLFYELQYSRKLDSTKVNLTDWIVASFVDKNGKEFKSETVAFYLREDQELKRVTGKKRIDVDFYIAGSPD